MSDPTISSLERELRAAYAEWPAPELGPSFHQRLRERLRHEQRQKLSTSSVILRFYWSFALLGSLLILWRIPWNEELLSGPFLIVLATLAALFLIPSLLVRRLGWAELLFGALATGTRD